MLSSNSDGINVPSLHKWTEFELTLGQLIKPLRDGGGVTVKS